MRFVNYLAFSLLAFFCLAIALYAFALPIIMPHAQGNALYVQFINAPLVPYTHFFSAGFALLLGPWQFLAVIRRRWLTVHKTLGKLYVLAVFIGALSGFMMALQSHTLWWGKLGFACLAFAWLITLFTAVWQIKQGNIAAHQKWMLRCFALTFAAVTLRLQIPLLTVAMQQPFEAMYPIIAWSCWLPNLLIIELVIWRFLRVRKVNKPV